MEFKKNNVFYMEFYVKDYDQKFIDLLIKNGVENRTNASSRSFTLSPTFVFVQMIGTDYRYYLLNDEWFKYIKKFGYDKSIKPFSSPDNFLNSNSNIFQ